MGSREHRLDVAAQGFQCPVCGTPIDTIRLCTLPLVEVAEPCGHYITDDPFLGFPKVLQ